MPAVMSMLHHLNNSSKAHATISILLDPGNESKAMSTAQRRRGESLHLQLPNGLPTDLPPLTALFLVLFDVKAG